MKKYSATSLFLSKWTRKDFNSKVPKYGAFTHAELCGSRSALLADGAMQYLD